MLNGLRTQMMAMADQLASMDIAEFPVYRARVSFKDNLVSRGVDKHLASRIAVAAKIEIGTTAGQDQELVDKMVDASAQVMVRLISKVRNDFPLVLLDDIAVKMSEQIEIELNW